MSNPLRAARIQAGFTLAQVAGLVNDLARRRGWNCQLRATRLSDYEHGRRRPAIAMAQLLIDALGLQQSAATLITSLQSP